MSATMVLPDHHAVKRHALEKVHALTMAFVTRTQKCATAIQVGREKGAKPHCVQKIALGMDNVLRRVARALQGGRVYSAVPALAHKIVMVQANASMVHANVTTIIKVLRVRKEDAKKIV